jgi:hypothetical protein
MQMRLSFLVALMVLIGFSAVPAMADSGAGNDPTLIVNKGTDPSCSPPPAGETCFSNGFSQADPLLVSNSNPQNFIWDPADGTDVLTALFVEFTFVPGQIYTCTSNIFSVCGTVAPSVHPTTDLEFEFTGGSISPFEEISAGVTPEPETLLLLGTGVISLLGFRRRKLS